MHEGEWPRPLSEIARPADTDAELFSLDTKSGKPREGAIPLERTRSAQKHVLQTEKEPIEHQIRKVYTLATERVEEVDDQEYKDFLRENLEDWYTRRIDRGPRGSQRRPGDLAPSLLPTAEAF